MDAIVSLFLLLDCQYQFFVTCGVMQNLQLVIRVRQTGQYQHLFESPEYDRNGFAKRQS